MKDRIITILIKTFADILALWLVFVYGKQSFVKYINSLGFADQRAVIAVLSIVAIFIASILLILIELFVFHFIFKPLCVEVFFRDAVNERIIKSKKIKLDGSRDITYYQESLTVNVLVHGGNKLTNLILNFWGSDIIIKYVPEAYDTEISDGFIASSKSNLYLDKNLNTRYYWTDAIGDLGRIEEEDAIDLRPKIIIKPKRFDVYRCKVKIKIVASKKKNIFLRLGFFLIKYFIIKFNYKGLKLEVK
mgnify:CR=1 FL=1